jgi:hypothetical protein
VASREPVHPSCCSSCWHANKAAASCVALVLRTCSWLHALKASDITGYCPLAPSDRLDVHQQSDWISVARFTTYNWYAFLSLLPFQVTALLL